MFLKIISYLILFSIYSSNFIYILNLIIKKEPFFYWKFLNKISSFIILVFFHFNYNKLIEISFEKQILLSGFYTIMSFLEVFEGTFIPKLLDNLKKKNILLFYLLKIAIILFIFTANYLTIILYKNIFYVLYIKNFKY